MKFALDTGSATYRISSYDSGQVTINTETVTHSVIVMPERLIRDWPPQRFEELETRHADALVELQPEIVLLGTGARLRFPAPQFMAALQGHGIGIEVMDTGAACRTYNVLMAEGRNVAAALLMI